MPKRKSYEIVVPLFDDEDNLVNLLNSLIDVGVSVSDIIISMSGPRGNIDKLAKKYDFRLVYSGRKLTPSEARNIGAIEAKAEYIVFLDSDILVTKVWKEALDEITGAHKIRLVGETYDVSSSPHWVEKNWFVHIRKLERTYLNGGNIIVECETFNSLNGFDESLETGEDFDFCIRARIKDVMLHFDERLIVHHEGNPKSISQFIKRERWHAKGDLGSLSAFLKSKVMIASAVYIMIIFLAIIFLVFGAYKLTVLFILLSLGLAFILTIYKLKGTGANILKSTVIMNFYLLGRGIALIESLLPRPWRA